LVSAPLHERDESTLGVGGTWLANDSEKLPNSAGLAGKHGVGEGIIAIALKKF
jgi:hypothetical protein